MAGYQVRANAELEIMGRALDEAKLAYGRFLNAARAFNWEAAEAARIEASALHEAGMDAFMFSCRALEEGTRDGV